MLFIPEIVILKSIFPFLAFLIAWEMIRKFFALYKAGQQKEIWRFICIFIFNTFGLLPIIYLLVDSTKDDDIGLNKENKKINTEVKQAKNTLKGGGTPWKKDLKTTETKRWKKQSASLENQKKQATKK